MARGVIRIVISSDPRLLHILRGVVRYRAEQAGFPAPDAGCLAMAIDEAASNVIRHTYGNRRGSELALEILPYPDRVEFFLEDTGPKVRPETLRPRPLDDVRPGGLGTFFINCFVDARFYDENYPGGNRLRLVKYLPGKGSPRNESSDPKHG